MGGDLNLSLGAAEIWGPKAIPDSQADFFVGAFARSGLADIAPDRLNGTWRNRRTGENRVAKRLERFLLDERLIDTLHFARQWVESGGISDHSPIMIEISGGTPKPPSPFKFNPGWMQDEEYIKLVNYVWLKYNCTEHGHAAVHFMENLRRIKEVTKDWARKKRDKENLELMDIELYMARGMEDSDESFSTKDRRG